ncbi:MAG: hypothetical protein UMR38_06670 [Candidatus Izemoplasma sp.]|nr:hypothetical protein [Candidatus Izemoplasma sp.]
MKLLLLGSMLFTGGSAVAMQNEDVNAAVNEGVDHVVQAVQHRLGRRLADTVSETGFPYPNETVLAQMTEEQAFAITSEIDQINAEYDWVNMSEEEIAVALEEIHERLDLLYTELGLELPQMQRQYRGANRKGQGGYRNDGNQPFNGECPYDDDTADDNADSA